MSAGSNAGAGSAASFPIAWILTIVFVVLKLTNTIDWSWWWVLCPLWLSAMFVVGVLILVMLIVMIAALIKG